MNNEEQLLNQEWEGRNVNRLEALVQLSQKRGTGIRTLMDKLGTGKSDEVF